MRTNSNIKWHERIINAEVYSLSKCKRWSEEIKNRRMIWLGTLCRFPDAALTKLALFKVKNLVTNLQGRLRKPLGYK